MDRITGLIWIDLITNRW